MTAFSATPDEEARPRRLRRGAFRLGVGRYSDRIGLEFKPIATVGLAKDGGIFVAPAPVRDFAWSYGLLRGDEPKPGEHITTHERPKLHYHRSGIASVTLTGADLERRSLLLPPLPSVEYGQVVSIVTQRPWELATTDTDRKGDVFTVVPRWPLGVAVSLSVVALPLDTQRPLIVPDLAPAGLIGSDPSRFVVSLSAYGREALLVGRFSSAVEGEPDLLPSTAIAALPWNAGDREGITETFGLWTARLRNPLIFFEPEPFPSHPLNGDLVVRARPRRARMTSP